MTRDRRDDWNHPMNVSESWSIYDTILISKNFYGGENNVNSWFNTFATFGAQNLHSFFKTRTEGTAGLAYCDQQSADTMDFAFRCYSLGVEFMGPALNLEADLTGTDGVVGDIDEPDFAICHFWKLDLANHCGVAFKVQQDTVFEAPAYSVPPGYGAMGGGAPMETNAVPLANAFPYNNTMVSTGVPTSKNRFAFKQLIEIPRTATIEVELHLSPYAQYVLQGVTGPRDYVFQSSAGGTPYESFGRRYGIRISLYGERLVQQRANYFR